MPESGKMRLIDSCLDKLNNTMLFEMAFERRKAMDTIVNLSPQIFEHFIKLFVVNIPLTKNHWVKEINGWFNIINKIYLKPKNRRLSYEEIYNWLIFESAPYYSSEFIDSSVQRMLRMEYKGIDVKEYDANQLLNIILNIIQNVARDIAKDEYKGIEPYLPQNK